jgi:hypothetical protein
VRYSYRPEIVSALLAHGVRPAAHTPPSLIRAYLNDLYRFEIRRLRNRLLAGAFPKREYAARVLDLRRKYPLLAVPVSRWTE